MVEMTFIFQKQRTALQKALIQSAFLFPSFPSPEQCQAAKAFENAARKEAKGWIEIGLNEKRS